MNATTSQSHRPWIPAGIVALLGTAALVIGALLLTGQARVVAVVVLGILIPATAAAAALATRRRFRARIGELETDLVAEREARLATERIYIRFTERLSTPVAQTDRLSQHIGDRSHPKGGGPGIDPSSPTTSPAFIREIEALVIAAQIDAGTYRPTPAIVHLDILLPEILNGCAHTPLEIELDVQSAPVWCDTAAVHQSLFSVLRTAVADGATQATITVEERNGLGVLEITDDRRADAAVVVNPRGLLATGEELPRHIVPALVEQQGGTAHAIRQSGHTLTVIRLPLATPVQLAGATAQREKASIP